MPKALVALPLSAPVPQPRRSPRPARGFAAMWKPDIGTVVERQAIWTKAKVQAWLTYIRGGQKAVSAGLAAGLPLEAIQRMIRIVEDPSLTNDPRLREIGREVRIAIAQGEQILVAKAQAANPKDWRPYRFLLEAVHGYRAGDGERQGPQLQVVVGVKVGQ